MLKTLICIGHGAYTGANAMKLCRTQSGAVKELVRRGVDPATAEVAVKDVMSEPYGYRTVRGEFSNVIEVANALQKAVDNKWPCLTYGLTEWKKAEMYANIAVGRNK